MGETTEAEVRNLIVDRNERPAFKPAILTHKVNVTLCVEKYCTVQ